MNMNQLIVFCVTSVFILKCGVLGFYTSDIESLTDAHLQKTEESGNSMDLDLPAKGIDSSVELRNNKNMLSTDDTIYLRDILRPRIKSNFLNLERRSWRVPFFIRRYKTSPDPSTVNRRRSQQLSVTGPLSSLASMLAAEGRRRQQSESINNRMRLLELGKRDTTGLRGAKSLESDLNDLETDLKHLPYSQR